MTLGSLAIPVREQITDRHAPREVVLYCTRYNYSALWPVRGLVGRVKKSFWGTSVWRFSVLIVGSGIGLAHRRSAKMTAVEEKKKKSSKSAEEKKVGFREGMWMRLDSCAWVVHR